MAEVIKVSQLSQHGVRELNEDAVLVRQDQGLYAVFDGASSLVAHTSLDGKTGAYIASNIACDAFAIPHESLTLAGITANDNIKKAHEAAGIDVTRNVNRFGTTAIVVKLLGETAELLSIGDSVALFLYRDGRVELPISYHDQDSVIMRKWRQLADKGATNIRQLIDEDMRGLRESANMAYGLLNGDPLAEQRMNTAIIGLEGVRSILLLSDGMYLPKSDPDEPENWASIAQLYIEGGLERIVQAVRELEDSDPGLITYPRYKIHDDASGVAIDLAH